MSHTTTVASIQITSISALRKALETLAQEGVRNELIENAIPRAYYSNQKGMGQADFVIKLKDCPYDIGLYAKKEGGYEARTDLWANEVSRLLGVPGNTPQHAMGKLYNRYAVAAIQEQADEQGFDYETAMQPDGTVIITVQDTSSGASAGAI